MQARIILAVITCAGLALAGCGKKEEAPKPAPAPAPTTAPAPAPAPAGVSVSSITTGKAVTNNKVTAPTETFAKGDTIYVSIDTAGSGNAKLDAKWTYSKDGKTAVVKEDSMTINAYGPATNEFHVSKPDGWPTGDYQVEVMLDGKPAGTKKFSVK
jgi:hypothetical protein